MRKKLLLLFVGVLCSLGMWADTTYTLTLNGSKVESKAGYFTTSAGKFNFNTKFTGSYGGTNYSSGLKMEGSTEISFTTNASSSVTIVQSKWSDYTILFDGEELAITSATDKGNDNVRVYTLTGLTAGQHKINRGTGESGLFYVSVTEAASANPVVDNITLSSTYAYGSVATPLAVDVTMVDATNDYLVYQWYSNTSNSTSGGAAISGATSSSYTPDISEVGVIYYYCIITEKKLSDNTQVGNPAVTNTVAIEVISSVETPVISEFNGTVEIDCSTTSAVIYYSIDNGNTWIEYTHPFTILDNDATVMARAQVGGGTLISQIAEHEVEAIKAKPGSSSIVLYYNTTDMSLGANDEGANDAALIGNEGTDYEEWSIQINDALSGNKKIASASAINGYTSIKNSNGRQIGILLPAGVVANRITIYSYVNDPTPTAQKNYWAEVCETTYGTSSIAMGSFSDASNPDIRVYALDNIEDEITFNNNGVSQIAFYAVIDYTILEGSITLNSEGFATYSGEKNVYVDGAQAYTCTFSGDKIDAEPIEGNVVPAYNGVLLYGEPGATVTLNYQKTAAALGANDLKPTTTAAGLALIEGALALSGKTFKKYTGNEFLPGKAYLPYNPSVGAKEIFNIFGGDEEEATEVTAVTEVEKVAAAKKYVKNGQFVIENANGVFNAAGAQIK